LPERTKRAILYAIYPQTKEKQGFPAFYDRCTPREMAHAMQSAGLKVDRVEPYFVSSYFMFLFPLHLLWRLVNVPLMKLWPMAFCETFVIRASKPTR
jgi:2-polyprenyl-6-hydroxyphenyl methylase/3-demethylubiquinone-9 3-methyltransferase